jgi:hypothetical protein
MANDKLMSMQQTATLSASTARPIAFTIAQNGVTIILPGSPLTRLNYFDGKFLRAADLQTEQAYLRTLVELSNQAGGPGVAHGFSASLASGTEILLDAGLAIDPTGRVLLLTGSQTVSIPDLLPRAPTARIAGAQGLAGAAFADCVAVTAAPGPDVVAPSNLYLLVIAHAEALCGMEDVYGKLCQEACITSTDRPFAVEGIVARLLPLTLALPGSKAVTLGAEHLRSRVASAYFEDERNVIGSLISKAGLQSEVWCRGAEGAGGIYVPLGVVGWTGTAASFFDAWTARRERMDTPAKRYWQWRIHMRPWDVFMAQILQFQCQLRDGLEKGTPVVDPCKNARTLVSDASTTVTELFRYYNTVSAALASANINAAELNNRAKATINATELTLAGGTAAVSDLMQRISVARSTTIFAVLDRLLIRQGIIELPSAGYLPVTPGETLTVNQQVRQWMGEGVNLRFCIVTPDYVQHALEEAQHMERISLIAGLDDPQAMPDVDILVPDGKVIQPKLTPGTAYQARLGFERPLTARALNAIAEVTPAMIAIQMPFAGAAYIDVPANGKLQLFTAVDWEQDLTIGNVVAAPMTNLGTVIFNSPLEVGSSVTAAAATTRSSSVWVAITCNPNPFSLTAGGSALLNVREASAFPGKAEDFRLNGELQFRPLVTQGSTTLLQGVFNGIASKTTRDASGTATPQTGPVTLEVRAWLTTTPEGPTLEVQFINPSTNLSYRLGARWSGVPRQISATFSQSDPNAETVAGSFIQSDDVVQPTNPSHASALRALDNIGLGLGDPQFSPASAAQLFPPPPPPTGDLQVEATLDWVLFHRRRTKQCQVEKVVTPVPSRRYQLWRGLVTNQDAANNIIGNLRNNVPIDKSIFDTVDVPEFAPGIATLLTQPSTILVDWNKKNPGQILAYGAIASSVAAQADGDPLAQARLQQVVQAIGQTSQRTSTTPLEVLGQINPNLAVPDVDGIIVLLTIVETVPHIFLAVGGGSDSIPNLIATATAPTAEPLVKVLGQFAITSLGTVAFKLKTADALSPLTPVDAWNRLPAPVPVPINAATFYFAGDGADEATINSRIDQAITVLKNIDPQTTLSSLRESCKVALGFPAPAVTVIAVGPPRLIPRPQADEAPAKPRTARLVPWRGSFLNRTIVDLPAPAFVSFAADGSLSAALPAEVVAALQKVSPAFASVELVPSEAQPDAAAQTRLDSIASALLQATLIQPTASHQITKIRPKEVQLLTTTGLTANEIVFLRVG